MGLLSFDDLYRLAVSVGFPAGSSAQTAAAIALAESNGNAAAVGDGGTSFGLWQVHTPAHPEYDATRLLDATYNAKAALAISSGGTNWRPWSTYNSGAYKTYLFPPPAFVVTSRQWLVFGAIAAVGAAAVYALKAPKRRRSRR